MQQKRTQTRTIQLAAFNCKPRWPKRNGTWDATKRNGTEPGRGNWPPSCATYTYIHIFISRCLSVCTYAKLYLTDLRDKPRPCWHKDRSAPQVKYRLRQRAASGANDSSQIGSQLKMKPDTRKGTSKQDSNGTGVALPIAAWVGVNVAVVVAWPVP